MSKDNSKIGASPADAGPGCHPFGAEPVPVSGIAGIPDAASIAQLGVLVDRLPPFQAAVVAGRADDWFGWFFGLLERARSYAQAIEAAAAGETRQGLDPKGESAVAEGDAPETPIREASTLARKDGL